MMPIEAVADLLAVDDHLGAGLEQVVELDGRSCAATARSSRR